MSTREHAVAFLARLRLPVALVIAAAALMYGDTEASPITPANDDFANAIDVGPGGIYVVPTGGAGTEAGEPPPSCRPSYGHSVWYDFTPPVSNSFAVDTFGSDFDTILAVYTGDTLGTLMEVACNDDYAPPLNLRSQVRIDATGGTTYHIQASGYAGESGSLDLNITELPFPVNTTDDHDDGVCDSFIVGDCTLREAINDSNALAFMQTISFSIFGGGQQTIQPMSGLPTITDPVVVDGTTQPGFSGAPIIELDGSNAGDSVDGLTITAGDSTVRGLVINSFGGNGFASGISIENGSGNVLETNFIGTDVTGTQARPNTLRGVLIFSSENVIGGTNFDEMNLISGNGERGVFILGENANNNLVQNNYIGTDVTGTQAVPNGDDGVHIQNASGNIIGGVEFGLGNVIAGNHGNGITVFGHSALDNVIIGNFIGTSESGEGPIGNGFPAGAQPSGGPQPPGDGIILGQDLTAGPQDTIIGGPIEQMRNVISGNAGAGIRVVGDGITNTVIQSNYIGTNESGSAAIRNTEGIVIDDSPGNLIGGPNPGEGNIISGNDFSGLALVNPGAANNVIQGNLIGPGMGDAPIGNGLFGVIASESGPNVIGGEDPAAGNTIAYNTEAGIAIFFVAPGSIRKAILSNSIHSNGGLGIDLEGDGVTPNDELDEDMGGNSLQNYPVLTSADSGSTTISGTLNSAKFTTFTLQFFSNNACDPSGYGEGETFLGSTEVTTDGGGDASFTASLAPTTPVGQFVTATATDPDNNTSEFSACIEVTGSPTPTPTPSPTPTTTPPGETPTPTPTPTGGPHLTQGDVDCDGSEDFPDVDAVDALKVLQFIAAIGFNQEPGCPPIASEVASLFGDVDCDGDVAAVDALSILRHIAALPVNQQDGCTPIGEPL